MPVALRGIVLGPLAQPELLRLGLLHKLGLELQWRRPPGVVLLPGVLARESQATRR